MANTNNAMKDKSGDPEDQGSKTTGMNYDRGPQDAERGNSEPKSDNNKVLTRDNGGKVPNGHGRW